VFFLPENPDLCILNQFFAMQIIVEVQNRKKLDLLIELLNSLEFVKSIRMADAPMNVVPTKVNGSFFSRYYGSLKTGLTPDEIDQHLNSLRKEWEHDTF
jgi:hypothetical protein